MGLSRIQAPRLTVILYHRVSDDVRDNLTVGIDQFNRQMEAVRRHCHVLNIEEVVAMTDISDFSKPAVCITFDDGYLDNYTRAVPILRRHGIPAAFFVSTGLIGTAGRFPHDLRRGNPPIPVMDWDQLRRMRDLGFTIGSHTVTHIDCAKEPEAAVWWELVESRATLQRELGLDQTVFAYPYGMRVNMTPERLALVKKAGYIACLSAYGGVNKGRMDPFNVRRQAIHWEFSDVAFLARCYGFARSRQSWLIGTKAGWIGG
jgi:peptidoglycan/xylan/chitin deacetylase (PgdA/CDA1 family)